ncbi:MAG: response regulator [Deltaproteobacteria bacterium]|nr:response regulator [Deltaproteobacteria bacterium]MCX7952235.1 response regulator [Deltaproteobacteria bacterium]
MIPRQYLNQPVLVADDFSTMRKIIKNSLQTMGFTTIIEAQDGVEAWEKLEKEPVILIISDWNMPRMQGIDLLKKVKQDPKYAQIPFIMVTAEGQKECVIEAIKSGVNNYVVKPFTTEVLEQKIQQVLK